MSKINEITPIYIKQIPENLKEGVLYISKEREMAIHLCACGCKKQAATALDKDGSEWVLTDNGGKVTLRPSIGNWLSEQPYHAHYHITDNKIDWN